MNGLIALLGSGEYLPVMDDVDRHLLDSVNVNGRAPRVVCLPTAAGQEGEESVNRWSDMGVTHFQRLGAEVQPAFVIDSDSANDPKWASLLEDADLIYFSGGNPTYLLETMRGSLAWDAAEKAWGRGAVFAGCSAGAMILAQKVPNFRVAGLKAKPGFQVIPPLYVLPHFDRMRGMFSALLFTYRRALKDDEYILGIDENTALVGKAGQVWTVMGQGKAHIITRDDMKEFPAGESLSLQI
jgi:cyanophycinase